MVKIENEEERKTRRHRRNHDVFIYLTTLDKYLFISSLHTHEYVVVVVRFPFPLDAEAHLKHASGVSRSTSGSAGLLWLEKGTPRVEFWDQKEGR